MQLKCIHGYFKFRETRPGQISVFSNMSGFLFEGQDDYFTFSFLKDAPKYSILGKSYLGVPAIKTFEGEPWEVMRENKLVYDFTKNLVVPISTIVLPVSLSETTNYFLSNGMIVPGSLTDEGLRVKDYAAFFLFDTGKFKYSEVEFE